MLATGFHWVFDTYSQATTRFLVVADYAFGHQMAHDLRAVISAGGGQVVGEALHPLSTPDFASFLLQAQASKAQVIGLANGGDDTTNAVKQAAEFGITGGGQKLAGLVIVISIVHGLGLEIARGLVFTESFYWDMNEATRAWSKRAGTTPPTPSSRQPSSASPAAAKSSRASSARKAMERRWRGLLVIPRACILRPAPL